MEKMPPFQRLPLPCPLLILLLLSLTSSSSPSPSSIYDVLQSHGLPAGLLPKGVREFKVDKTGQFEVHLERPCYARFESEVHYEQNVSGVISYGQIGAVSGLSAQDLFLWLSVVGIRVDVPSSGIIYFDFGVVRKQFPLSLFETPPDCLSVEPSGEFIQLRPDRLEEGRLRNEARA